jgi:hypothetical protein
MSDTGEIDPGDICSRGEVTTADVAAMRESYERDGLASEADAEAMLAINHSCAKRCPEWDDLFVEAMAGYVVNTMAPYGYMTEAKSGWLAERIAPEGKITNDTELELLLATIEDARFAPTCLRVLAISQVLDAVRGGTGPLRPDAAAAPGRITMSDVGLLKRILGDAAGAECHPVTQAEAAMLFQIEDMAIAEEEAAAAWQELFVRALTHHALADAGYRVPRRNEALSSAAIAGPDSRYRPASGEELALMKVDATWIDLVTQETAKVDDRGWLVKQLEGGGHSEAEQALVELLKANGLTLEVKTEDGLANVA